MGTIEVINTKAVKQCWISVREVGLLSERDSSWFRKRLVLGSVNMDTTEISIK